MKFIEMTGGTLIGALHEDELSPDELAKAGVNESTIVRINQQGDIEVRRPEGWDIIGGLIGDYEKRMQKASGLGWA
ncbi:hypothetical protein [Blastopirellula marina]|uniref:Uncharacterized protein n=1 Tax=Blastopirellula marina DSM 3645 TaxID=314230 RepID=A3ZQ93_9BACT|nr:hypothetical protein [Blastopirellula marina]EAQ81366.1 hypothetical protein DSM3645_23281 [Blastopirellula marina DSM 3645]